jgi:sugar-specific transcriptional regulator TrmB
MLEKQLIELGLSDKEAAVYLALLRHGTQTTSFLAKKAKLNRGTAYVALHSLLEKGLLTKSTRRKIQYFSALDPKQLLDYLSRREAELRIQRERVSEMLPEFEAIINPLATKPRIQFFDGVEGARTAYEDTLNSEDKTLRAFLSIADISEFLGDDWFETYTKKRIERGYTLHAIRTLEKDKQAMERLAEQYTRYVTSENDSREVRYAPDDLAFPLTMYMYDDKVTMISSREENFALIITSREVSQMQKKLFSLLWITSQERR